MLIASTHTTIVYRLSSFDYRYYVIPSLFASKIRHEQQQARISFRKTSWNGNFNVSNLCIERFEPMRVVNAGNEQAVECAFFNNSLHRFNYLSHFRYQCFMYMYSSSSIEECFECEWNEWVLLISVCKYEYVVKSGCSFEFSPKPILCLLSIMILLLAGFRNFRQLILLLVWIENCRNAECRTTCHIGFFFQ